VAGLAQNQARPDPQLCRGRSGGWEPEGCPRGGRGVRRESHSRVCALPSSPGCQSQAGWILRRPGLEAHALGARRSEEDHKIDCTKARPPPLALPMCCLNRVGRRAGRQRAASPNRSVAGYRQPDFLTDGGGAALGGGEGGGAGHSADQKLRRGRRLNP